MRGTDAVETPFRNPMPLRVVMTQLGPHGYLLRPVIDICHVPTTQSYLELTSPIIKMNEYDNLHSERWA